MEKHRHDKSPQLELISNVERILQIISMQASFTFSPKLKSAWFEGARNPESWLSPAYASDAV